MKTKNQTIEIAENKIAQVIMPIPVDTPFSYSIPVDLLDLILPGVQVTVPFGERYSAGIVLSIGEPEDDAEFELKPIHDVVNAEPFASAEMIKLLEWIADYYICTLGEAFRLINPSVNLNKSSLMIKRAVAEADNLRKSQQELWDKLEDDWLSLTQLEKRLKRKNLLHRIHLLKKKNLIETFYKPPEELKIYKTVDLFSLQKDSLKWTQKAREKYLIEATSKYAKALELIEYLRTREGVDRNILREAGFNSALLKRLKEENVLLVETKKLLRSQELGYSEKKENIVLTDEQAAFVDQVKPKIAKEHQGFLLHGITGSGKTQIYIELIREAVSRGTQAIVLIPEIILTPQTMARFSNTFGDRVAVIHSRLSKAEKLEVLQRIREGHFDVVIGPRSAIFAPFKKLGIIVVDEEHEGSYKQHDSAPRYHARDVALYRGYLNKIPVVLGSASPGFESLFNALAEKRYAYYYLSSRVGARSLPRIRLIDQREEWRKSGERPILSENLELEMEARLVIRQQAMLLQNRRGFAPWLQCGECGYVMKCENCDITLTYHTYGRKLRCHYCDYTAKAPEVCPDCQSLDIKYEGIGTQMIEQQVIDRFPHSNLLRMDQDTTKRKGDHAKILAKFRNKEADFLVGTKMIAKGLDFEQVTLVGIISADQGLQFPDFRATEKTFQMLMQAAGRAGRGALSGEVLIQTYEPDHYMFKYLRTHNYLDFFKKELQTRKTLSYPPYSRLCLIRVSGENENNVSHYAQEISRFLYSAKKDKSYSVLGPAPAALQRLNGRYRYHILVKQDRKKDPSMSYVRHLLKRSIYLNAEIKKWPVEIAIDMDPVEIL